MASERFSESKLVLVTRSTRVDELVARFNTLDQARFYVEHSGADFSDYLAEHERYRAAMFEAQRCLEQLGRVQTVDRRFLPNFIFGPQDTVLALGQDGLVANTLKYLSGQPLLGVNPDPRRWDGVLLPFVVGDLPLLVPEVLQRRRRLQGVTMAEARLNNGQRLLAVNDLFIGPKSHISARYLLRHRDLQETHSSSGLIVSTGLGSTGWLKSILTGATGIASALSPGGPPPLAPRPIPWDTEKLVFSVREPFPSKTSQARLVFGEISKADPLQIVSQMPEHGVIFSDGVEADFLEFNSGIEATVTVAEMRGQLVV